MIHPIGRLRRVIAIPGSVESLFAAMVAKEPDERPQTMAEVIGLLEGCLSESPASAEPPTESFEQRAVPPETIEDWAAEDPLEEVQLDKTVAISQRLLEGSSRGDSRR